MAWREAIEAGVSALADEAVGLVGGALFFGSWLLQAIESRRAGRAVVSIRFFAVRAAASALLAVEGLRAGSISVFAVMAATLVLMLYNIWLELRQSRGRDDAGGSGGAG